MQMILVIVTATLASLYLAWGLWRTCTGGCKGCGTKAPPAPPRRISTDELTARLRAKTPA
jgi:hypothetical protein